MSKRGAPLRGWCGLPRSQSARTYASGQLHVSSFLGVDWASWHVRTAAQAVLHQTWSEAIAGFPELRQFIRSESYRPAGQQP
jgi:hypothetical protein